MKRTTAKWVRKAEADWLIAVQSSQSETPVHDGVCFHCQQCVEKYLKGLLEEQGLSISKTHDLDKLRTVLLPHYPSLRPLRRGLVFLTTFAVTTRYPGDDANQRQAEAALRWAEKVRTVVRGLLGI
jgi:HEPN domain-containing protein